MLKERQEAEECWGAGPEGQGLRLWVQSTGSLKAAFTLPCLHFPPRLRFHHLITHLKACNSYLPSRDATDNPNYHWPRPRVSALSQHFCPGVTKSAPITMMSAGSVWEGTVSFSWDQTA